MSEDLEAAEADAVGRVPAEAHPSILKAPGDVLTPDERALDAELALFARRKWRRAHAGMARLICPLCGSEVPDDPRARGQHIEWHKEVELVRAAVGRPPGTEVLTVDYASMAERATHHSHIAVSAALVLMLALAITIVISVM